MGLARFAYNTVVCWNRRRCFYTKNNHTGVIERIWLKPQSLKKKLELFTDIQASKDSSREEDIKIQKAAVWGERKFLRAVVRLDMLLRGTYGIAPVNIIDEAIDEALFAKDEVIKWNTNQQGFISHTLSLRSRKDLHHTLTIHAQNFSKFIWNWFYISYLHTSLIYSYTHRHKICLIIDLKSFFSYVYCI
jgi:hypothetical protein